MVHHGAVRWSDVHATRILAMCLMAACYSAPQPDCGFICGPSGECPADYQCASDNRCHRRGTPASLVCAPDAAPPPPPRDADGIDTVGYDAPADADVTAPLVMSSTPANLATGVARTTTITIVFDEAVINVDTASFSVTVAANPVAGTLVAQGAQTYVFTPNSVLMPNTTVTVSLTAAITDAAGNALVPVSITFDTGN